jgi:flagellar biosynthesis protein FlhF
MRLKSFYAKSMTEAMQMVRESLGEDAIIIATREENGGKSVRVTAAIENDLPAASARARAIAFELSKGGDFEDDDNWLQYDEEQEQDSSLTEAIIDVMLSHSVPEDVLDQIVNCAEVMNLDEPSIAFVGALDSLFDFTPLPMSAYKKAMMFVGSPGAGKTLAIAKQAARAVLEDLDVAVITTDTIRAGGIEQLQAFTKLLDIDLQTARNPADLKQKLLALKGKDQILIDTSGINPFSTQDMTSLARLIAAGDIEPILIVAAAGDANETGEMARIFSALGVRRMVATRLDMARRLGGLLAAAQQGGLAFADASTTPSVADGLEPLSPRKFGSFFFPNGQADRTDSRNLHHQSPSRHKTTG